MSAATAAMPLPGNSGNPPPEATPVERRCENADCNASKLLSMVPKRKTQQFVTEPNVMDKPMLINGFTTVFQVDGNSAKLSDLRNVPSSGATHPKTIYRIVPNTHAHIVNYVVVDAEGESLRKINESDPATMRKLLESQKVSADQMLKKLIAGVSVTVGTNPGSAGGGMPAGINAMRNGGAGASNLSVPPSLTPISSNQAMSAVTTKHTTSTLAHPIPASMSAAVQQQPPPLPPQLPLTNSQIQLPVRMHPNLKITAVASADTVSAMNAVPQPMAVPSTQPTVPLITPVPLSTLQSQPVLMQQQQRTNMMPTSAVSSPKASLDTVEKPVFDKMQAELQELRRTVAMLAEAQAKNQMTSMASSSSSTTVTLQPKPNTTLASALRGVKRLRQN